MEPNNNTSNIDTHIDIDHIAREHLKTITTWARIVALVGFINAGFTFIGLFTSSTNSAVLVFNLFFGLIIVAIMVVMYLFLLRFANSTASSLNTQSQEAFNYGIDNLRTYFKIIGIILIIALGLLVLFFLVFSLGATMA